MRDIGDPERLKTRYIGVPGFSFNFTLNERATLVTVNTKTESWLHALSRRGNHNSVDFTQPSARLTPFKANTVTAGAVQADHRPD